MLIKKVPAAPTTDVTPTLSASNSQRLGTKAHESQLVTAGSIIVRQRGTRFYPGNNVGMGKDYTIYAMVEGRVKFERKGRDKRQISVYPVEEAM